MKSPSKPKCFKAKETALNKAIDRVKKRLQYYADESAKIKHNWSDADRERFKDWNLLHDLQLRLENRLWDNWSAYKDWHWDTQGFNTY